MKKQHCFRCRQPLPKNYEAVNDKPLGTTCYDLYLKRERLKQTIPNELKIDEFNVFYTETEYCKSPCTSCTFFTNDVCPLQTALADSVVGRRR